MIRQVTFCGGGEMVVTGQDCRYASAHTPHPAGYIAHAEWAEAMLKTHRQVKCPGCGLYAIWVPRS